MRAISSWITVSLAWLCRLFGVKPENLRNGRRGNLPPETGGLSS